MWEKAVVLRILCGMAVVVAAAGAAVATPWAEVGNPGLNQFPTNSVLDCTARSAWDMEYYDGKIYIGTGDYWNNSTSRIGGKLNVWTMAANETFAKEYAVDEEMIARFRQYDGKLFIPGSDPTESWDWGNLYVGNHGSWQKLRTLPNGVHCDEFAIFNNNYYAITEDAVGPTHLVKSTNQGQSWTDVDRGMYGLIPEDGYMLAGCMVDDPTVQPYGRAPAIRKYLPDGTSQTFETPYNGLSASIGFEKEVTFQGRVVHTRPQWTRGYPEFAHAKHEPGPNGLWSLDLSNLQAGSSAVGPFANAYVQDIVARNDRCYVLTAAEVVQGQQYKGQIWDSSDLQDWSLLADFDVSAIPTSFELTAANTFCVGLGNGDVDNQAFAEAGSILRIVTPEPSSLMLCVTSSLALLAFRSFPFTASLPSLPSNWGHWLHRNR
jgi:hypothetical protein